MTAKFTNYIRGWINRGGMTAAQLNSYKKGMTFDKTASNAPIPTVYGTCLVDGFYMGHTVLNDNLVIRVGWCVGEVKAIKNFWVNEAITLGKSITVIHYRGTLCQSADISLLFGWPGETDDMILRKPTGEVGICYSMVTIPVGQLSAPPRFKAVIEGRLVRDPLLDSNASVAQLMHDGDPFFNEVSFSVYVRGGTSGSTPTGMDKSKNNQTLTWLGTAAVDATGNRINFPSTGSPRVTLPDATLNEFGGTSWSVETTFNPAVVNRFQPIILKNVALMVWIANGGVLWWRLSSNGTTWMVEESTGVTCVAGTTYHVNVEFDITDWKYSIRVNGLLRKTYRVFAHLNNSANPWTFGSNAGVEYFYGWMDGIKFTAGYTRYSGEFKGTPTTHWDVINHVYPDGAYYRKGYTFSDNPALCFADLAQGQVLGMGATYNDDELSIAKQWCDSTLTGGVTRARFSYNIDQVRPTEDWLDLIAAHAQLLWHFKGTEISMVPDRPAGVYRGSGPELITNSSFENGLTGWTTAAGGGAWSAVSPSHVLMNGANTTLATIEQGAISLTAGTTYIVTFELVQVTAGKTVTARFNGKDYGPYSSGVWSFAHTATSNVTATVQLRFTTASTFGYVAFVSVRSKYWEEASMEADSLSVEPVSSADSPNKVNISFIKSETSAVNWMRRTETYAMPDAEDGVIDLVETTVSMDGIYRIEEALNRAQARVQRMRNRIRYTWVTGDIGYALSNGVVARISVPAKNVDAIVLIDSVQLLSVGRYAISGMRHSDDQYPDSIPLEAGLSVVPIGAIVPYRGLNSTIPAGWTRVAGVDNRAIRGTTTSPNTTGGAATVAINGNAGAYAHKATAGATFLVRDDIWAGGAVQRYLHTLNANDVDSHIHAVSMAARAPNLYRVNNILIEKTGSTSATFPSSVFIFGKGYVGVPGLVQSTGYQGRYLSTPTGVSAESSLNGVTSEAVTATVGNGGAAHTHMTTTYGYYQEIAGAYQYLVEMPTVAPSGGAAHAHSGILTLLVDLFRYRMGLYASATDFQPEQNLIIGWKGSVTAMPDSYWTLCDGRLGTPDLHDLFIEVASSTNKDTTEGNGIVWLLGNLGSGGAHLHTPNGTPAYVKKTKITGHSWASHTHTFIGFNAWTPPYYALAFLMFNPYPTLNFNDVQILLGGGGTNGGTVIDDASVYNLNGVETAVTYSNAWNLGFGSATSIRFSTGQLMYTAAVMNYAHRRFTLEFFLRTVTVSGTRGIATNHATAGTGETWELQMTAATTVEFKTGGVSRFTATVAGTANTVFYAVQFNGVTYSVYYGLPNGYATLIGSYDVASPATYVIESALTLGNNAGLLSTTRLDGYMEEVRYTPNVARYDDNSFAVPTAKWPRS